jgi:hypothetical protein
LKDVDFPLEDDYLILGGSEVDCQFSSLSLANLRSRLVAIDNSFEALDFGFEIADAILESVSIVGRLIELIAKALLWIPTLLNDLIKL